MWEEKVYLEINQTIEFDYVNWCGQKDRKTAKIKELYFGTSEYYKDFQLILVGRELERNEEISYAMKDMSNVKIIQEKDETLNVMNA